MYKNVYSKYESILRISLILILEIILPFKILIYLINNENINTLSNIENYSVIIFIILGFLKLSPTLTVLNHSLIIPFDRFLHSYIS